MNNPSLFDPNKPVVEWLTTSDQRQILCTLGRNNIRYVDDPAGIQKTPVLVVESDQYIYLCRNKKEVNND